MPSTTTKGVPYTVGSDAASNIDTIVQTLAEWVDGRPGIASLTTTERDALSGATRWTGRVVWNSTNQRFEGWNAVSWVPVSNMVQVLSTTQRNLLAGDTLWLGLVIYNTTLSTLQVYNGATWKSLLDEDDVLRVALRIRRVAAQTIAFTTVPLSWDTETQDTESNFTPHATTATTITVAKDGIYSIFVSVSSGAFVPDCYISVGGITYRGCNTSGNTRQISAVIPFSAGNTFQVIVSGGIAADSSVTGELILVRTSL